MKTGTYHFISRGIARKYYSKYGYTSVFTAVERKIKEGEICIGPPALKPGQKLSIDSKDGRYIIEE